MTQYEKLLEKFLKNPDSIGLLGIKKILEKNGYKEKQGKGSHVIYFKEGKNDGNLDIVLPIHNNDVKKGYKIKVKKVLFNK